MSEAEKHEQQSQLKQPRIFVVGEEIDNLIFFVTVADRKFYCTNIYNAVEAAMFFFLGLNIEYPCECEVVWEYIQQQIFDVPSQKKSSHQLQELIQKLGKK